MRKYKMTEQEQTVSKVFSLIREGNCRDGTELLYKRYYKQMYSMAFAVLKNEQDSRDAVHNVIAKLLSINTQSLPDSNELGWLYTVVKNEAVDLRKRNSATLPLDDSFIPSDDFEDEGINSLIDMDAYQKKISHLDTERQEIVTLKVIGGFTHREISEIIGKPVGTIQWLYATAIAKLRKSVPMLLITAILTSAASIRQLLSLVDTGNGDYIPDTGLPSQGVYTDCLVILLGIASALCIAALIYIFAKGIKAPQKTKNR